MLYVYGLIEERRLPACAGLDGTTLERVDAGGVSAVVGRVDAAPDPTETRLWEHESVLEALMAEGPVLPVRFGVVYRERSDLVAELAARRGPLAAALARVRGRVEVGVRVLEHPGAPRAGGAAASAEGAGARYLLDKLERRRDAAARVRAVQDTLSRLAVAERSRLLPRPETKTLLTASYLVEHGDLDAFAREVSRLQRDTDGIDLVCTGPWPPYSFADEEEAA